MLNYTFRFETVEHFVLRIILHPYFVLLSGRLFSAFVEDVAGYIEKKMGNKMTATMRKTDEELTDKRKCKIGGLMTDWG